MNTTKRASLSSCLLLLLMFPLVSWGHVHMDKSIPAKGDAVSPAPESLQLWFSGGVEMDWSKIEVKSEDGTRMDDGEISHINDSPKTLKVKLKPLPSGTYKVKWNIVAHDGHRIKGNSHFSVK
ncbi:MAG: copper resistance protein CopC [Gammaproteobacteria bacterium]|nr:copper resistance protein CopC [Gammaproteobacteria bacterium]